MNKSKIDEIIDICQSFIDGHQSLDASIIYEIHQLALETKSES